MNWIHSRLSGLDQVPDTEPYRHVREFADLHRDLLPEGHLHEGEVRCRPVPARRHFGEFRWFDEEHGVVVGAYWPSFQPHASSFTLAFPASSGMEVRERAREIGFPIPDEDPTMVIGRMEDDEGASWVYVPGPERIVELVYRLRKREDGRDVIISAERPPGARYIELVRELRRAFGWDGSLVFDSFQAFREKDGHLEPPGALRLGERL